MKLSIEIKHAFASLKQSLGFSVTLILTLALTLGTLLAAFNINQVMLYKSLPYPNGEQLFFLQQNYVSNGKDNIGGQVEAAQYEMYRESKHLFESSLISQQRGILLSSPSKPMLVALYVSDEYFSLLGVQFSQGRALTPTTDVNSAEKEAILSYELWQNQFGGKADIVGTSLEFQDQHYRIVGVVKKSLATPDPFIAYGKTDLYLPMAYSGFNDKSWKSAPRNLNTLVSLKKQQSPQEIMAKLNQVIAEKLALSEDAKLYQDKQIKAHMTLLSDEIKGDSKKVTLLILAGAFALLLIAFANVVNLYLSHIAKKQQLLAICACVGAKPKALFKRLFVESLLLTITATVFALIIAAWLLVFTQHLAQGSLPRLSELHIDATTVLFSFFIAIFLASLLAYFGRFAVNYNALKEQLNASGKGSNVQISHKIRQSLITSQVAITGILLIASTLVLESTLTTANTPLGFNDKNVLSFQIDAGDKYKTREEKAVILEQVKQHFASLGQIKSVSKNLIPPIRIGNFSTIFQDEQGNDLGTFGYNTIDSNYFDLLELPLLYGRTLTPEEVNERKKVVVVSESVALQAFGRKNVIGEYVYFSPEYGYEIIGVVGDHFNAYTHKEFQGHAYFAMNNSRLNILLKTKETMSFTQADIIKQVAQVDSSLRVLEYAKLTETKTALVYQYKLAAWLSAGLSILAILLACAGIYGVISYSMQMRRYELGIRMAVGAKKIRVLTMLIKGILTPLLTGILMSLVVSILLYLSFSQSLIHLGQPDYLKILLSIVLMLVFSLLACVLPVQKVINNDPIKALRNE